MAKTPLNKTNVPAPVPAGFAARMGSQLGADEASALVGALDAPPSVSIRINRRKVSEPGEVLRHMPQATPVPWCPSGFYLASRPDFILDPLLHAGAYYVQEAASMVYESIVAEIVAEIDDERHLRVLDLCAAPGGKSTAILNGLVGRRYSLVANEVDGKRAGILKENLDKWGDPDVFVTCSPTDRFARLEGVFDIVAVDAPCSGEGMMRREPVARSQWSEGLVSRCAALQRQILADAVAALRPGGALIYSTCTFNEEENEMNVKWLIDEMDMEIIREPQHFMPHRCVCEGLFVAVLRKPDAPGPSHVADMEKALRKAGVTVLSAGTEKVVRKGALEVPSSRQVLAYDFDRRIFPMVELGRDEALAYLRCEAIRLPDDTPKGFVTVAFQGHPLGLVKNLGSRANNLYPREWRILKNP